MGEESRRVGSATGSPRVRIALYSHDALGLGHIRRNLLIAETLAVPPTNATVLLIAGSEAISRFPMPPHVDCLSLPGVRKEANESYHARELDLSWQTMIRLRATSIRAALDAYRPDIFIVDKVPRGIGHELDLALESLRAQGHAYCVLGLRDILDDPAAVLREWQSAENEEAIRKNFDKIWVYGSPAVYELARECQFAAAVEAKVEYTGYLDGRRRIGYQRASDDELMTRLTSRDGNCVVCMVGGGEDGAQVALAFAGVEFPADWYGVLVSGPFMPPALRKQVFEIASENQRLQVVSFLEAPEKLLNRADCVITMGGYNTLCEVLAYQKRALIVPRVKPRTEQWIRATRFRDLGLVDVLHPDQVSPAAFVTWISQEVAAPSTRARVDMDGLTRLSSLVAQGLASVRRRDCIQSADRPDPEVAARPASLAQKKSKKPRQAPVVSLSGMGRSSQSKG